MGAENGWLRAADTTLGADNGIGAAAGKLFLFSTRWRLFWQSSRCAAAMHCNSEPRAGIVLMQEPHDKPLPPLEILFTTVREQHCFAPQFCCTCVHTIAHAAVSSAQPHDDLARNVPVQEEEIGLNGAKALDRAALQLTAQRLVNMDSEEWGEICIGCAGGGHSTMTLPVATEAAREGSVAVRVAVSGLMGGHSGLTIGEYRCDAALLLQSLLILSCRSAACV